MPEPHRSARDGYLERYRRTHHTNIFGRSREFNGVRRDGTLIPIEPLASRLDIPGAAEPWFRGIIHDISERKHLEAAIRPGRLGCLSGAAPLCPLG